LQTAQTNTRLSAMPFCCASTAALVALANPSSATNKRRRDASVKELEDTLASAKAGELRTAQLQVALAAAVRRSDLVARRVVGLEAELEGASRLLHTLEEDETVTEGVGDNSEVQVGLAATRSLWHALLSIERVVAESDERVAAPLCGSLASAWDALSAVDARMCKLEADKARTDGKGGGHGEYPREHWVQRFAPWNFGCFLRGNEYEESACPTNPTGMTEKRL